MSRLREDAVPSQPRRPMCVVVVELGGTVRHYSVTTSPDVHTVEPTTLRYTDLDAMVGAVREFLQASERHGPGRRRWQV